MAADMMTMLLAELNMRNAPDTRKEQLQQLLDVAADRIAQKGITLDHGRPGDVQLQVDFAAWLYKRKTQADAAMMPRYLQLDIHDRLISEKGRT